MRLQHARIGSALATSAAALALLVACGSNDDAGGSPSAGDGLGAAIAAAGAAIVDEWGERDGFAVALLAADRGYSVEQIVEKPAIEGDGSIEGVSPAGLAEGLIEPALVRAFAAQATAGAAAPSDGYVAFVDRTLGEIFEAAKSGQDERRSAAPPEAVGERGLGIALGLLARGYTLEQVIATIVLDDWEVQSVTAPPCLYIPGEAATGADAMRGTCPGVPSTETTSGSGGAAAASGGGGGDGDADGTYVGDALVREAAGVVLEVISTTVRVVITDDEADGRIEHLVVVVTDDAGRTVTQQAAQTIEFIGAVSEDGTFEGAGRTRVSYEVVGCEPAERCDGVTATRSAAPDGVAVTLVGTVQDGVLAAEIKNSVSGAISRFEARRKP